MFKKSVKPIITLNVVDKLITVLHTKQDKELKPEIKINDHKLEIDPEVAKNSLAHLSINELTISISVFDENSLLMVFHSLNKRGKPVSNHVLLNRDLEFGEIVLDEEDNR